MDKKQYPILLIPDEIWELYHGNPYPKSFDLTRPVNPVYETYEESKAYGCVSVLVPFAFVISVLDIIPYFTGDLIDGAGAILLICILICLYWLIAKSSESNKKSTIEQINSSRRNEFVEKTKEYEKKLQEYQELKLIEANREKNLAYKVARLKELLNNTSNAKIEFIGKKGRVEKMFYRKLKEIFDECIYINVIIENFSSNQPYQADIIFHEEKFNIWIDIEIDEPYEALTKSPIHYIDLYNSSIDEDRDEYFKNHGWFIIRFSENQILSNILGCCKFLNDFLIDYFGIEDYTEYFEDVEDLIFEDCWTYEESVELATKNYRRLL